MQYLSYEGILIFLWGGGEVIPSRSFPWKNHSLDSQSLPKNRLAVSIDYFYVITYHLPGEKVRMSNRDRRYFA